MPSDSSLGSDDGGVGGRPNDEADDCGSILMFSLDITILAGVAGVDGVLVVVQMALPLMTICWLFRRLCEAGVSWRVPFWNER